MTSHPLDHEDIYVVVTLVHGPTATSVSWGAGAPADGQPTVYGATLEALEHALDKLLAELETKGG